jgi:hypothetical protein
MNAAGPAPRSIGQILGAGFTIYRKSFVALIPLMLLMGLFNGATQWVMPNPSLGGRSFPPHVGTFLLVALLTAVPRLAILIGIIRKLDNVAMGDGAMGAMNAVSEGLRYLARAIGALMLVVVISVVGFVLLIVPGIYWGIALYLVLYALIFEDLGVYQSLRRSRELVRGNWWRVANIALISVLILAAVAIGVAEILGVSWSSQFLVSVPGDAAGAPEAILTLPKIALTVAVALMTPLTCAIGLVTYYDLRIRQAVREGSVVAAT